MKFKVGSVVQLASGGPPMTVIEIEEKRVRCKWFDNHNNLQEDDFDPVTLVPVPNGPEYVAGGIRQTGTFR